MSPPQTVKISAEVIEELKYGSQQWVTVRLPNQQVITINRKLVVFDEKTDSNSKQNTK